MSHTCLIRVSYVSRTCLRLVSYLQAEFAQIEARSREAGAAQREATHHTVEIWPFGLTRSSQTQPNVFHNTPHVTLLATRLQPVLTCARGMPLLPDPAGAVLTQALLYAAEREAASRLGIEKVGKHERRQREAELEAAVFLLHV